MVFVFCFMLTGCQAVTRSWGGEMTLDLPADQKLMKITWKDDSLWYLTRPMAPDEVAETYTFQESSNTGLLEGTVTINETKTLLTAEDGE